MWEIGSVGPMGRQEPPLTTELKNGDPPNMNTSLFCRGFFVLAAITCLSSVASIAQQYELGPLSQVREDVAKGKVEGPFVFAESRVFEETSRHYWVYLPPGFQKDEELALMVFQDGHAYVGPEGQIRAPTVFDNLIADKALPRLCGIFVNPGHRGEKQESADNWRPRSNRSVEYDSLGDDYARFLIEELIPKVCDQFEVKISDDPGRRAICGMSSGGICAWTVAWERPDSFGRVLSHIGSFTNIRGGHVYPALIRKTDRKPIRVFLQDGANDLNNSHGSWPLANQQMASALAFAGYEHRFVFGEGAHSGEHGGAIFPDSLRWLWKSGVDVSVVPKELSGEWERVSGNHAFTDGICADDKGNVYYSDLPKSTVYRCNSDGKAEPWLTDGPRISGLDVGPGGMIYAATQGKGEEKSKNIVTIDPVTKKMETIAVRVTPNDLAVSDKGWIYVTDTGAGTVIRVSTKARGMPRPPVVAGGINKPNGIALNADGSELWVSEYGGENLWRFSLNDKGDVVGGEKVGHLALAPDKKTSGGDGMTIDTDGKVYVTSHLGVQVFDSAGKCTGVIPRPGSDKPAVSCVRSGDWLYLCNGDQVFRRRISG